MKVNQKIILIGFYLIGTGSAFSIAWRYGKEYFENGARGPGLMALGSLMSGIFLLLPSFRSIKHLSHPNAKISHGTAIYVLSATILMFGSIALFIAGYILSFADAA